MKAKLIRKTTEGMPGVQPGQHIEMEFFTLGHCYEVIAMYQYEACAYLVLLDDRGRLVSRYSYCFGLKSKDIPEEWRINVVNEAQTIIIGPEFLIEYEDLAALLDYDPRMTEKFREYMAEYFE